MLPMLNRASELTNAGKGHSANFHPLPDDLAVNAYLVI